jgi:hemoglobin-like flavoprotein
MLTKEEIEMVRADWRGVLPLGMQAATLFYDRLFELDPALRPLFKSDLSEQKNKLLQILGAAVQGLDDLPAMVPTVRALGRRHAGYGVKREDYSTVGSALLWTLKSGIGAGFDARHEAAWTKVYGLLSETMRAAAMEAPGEYAEGP